MNLSERILVFLFGENFEESEAPEMWAFIWYDRLVADVHACEGDAWWMR
jgi:hypothetical protein